MIRLNIGDLATSTIDPNIKLRELKGKKTEMTAEYFSSASDTSLTDNVVNK
jgi:hypothetical protein